MGKQIYKNVAPNNPYQKWIDTYSGKGFEKVVEDAICLTNRVAEEINQKQLSIMKESFIMSTRLECVFRDSVYRLKCWKP